MMLWCLIPANFEYMPDDTGFRGEDPVHKGGGYFQLERSGDTSDRHSSLHL